MKVLGGTSPQPGRNLTLHLDADLQRAATEALAGRRGAVVAIEPSTGGVLALVSLPSYDPNPFVTGIDRESYAQLRDSIDTPLFNRAIQGQYEPGSTLKPFLGFAGLNTGVATPGYTINDPGWYRLPNDTRIYRDWNWHVSGSGGHGVVNLERAIYRSCNIYFYDLAVRMGIDRIDEQRAGFGFGQDTSFDIPDAQNGLLPSAQWKKGARGEPWYTGDTVNIGIGQGDLLVTPLQLTTAVAVLANRGRWVQPRILKESQSTSLPRSRNRLPHNVKTANSGYWEAIISGMEKVVHRGNQVFGENGTAWAYIGRDIQYRMAGKSGTAQVVGIEQDEEYDEKQLGERHRKHAWFIAFAPVDVPQIALAVLVENGGGGSEMAAPIARSVLDEYLLHGPGARDRMAQR
jgi:penicillin-binding protein 2